MKNTIRQYSLPGYELRDYTTEAIAFLIAGVKYQAFYSCTRIDPPEVVRYTRKLLAGISTGV